MYDSHQQLDIKSGDRSYAQGNPQVDNKRCCELGSDRLNAGHARIPEMRSFNIDDLKSITQIPNTRGHEWLVGAEGSIDFLRNSAVSDEIVIYARTSCVLIHGVLALNRRLTPAAASSLQHQNIPMPDDSWRIQRVWGGGKGHRMYLEGPLESLSDALVGGEKLIFRRTFEGVSRGPAPIELSQKLVHSLELNFVPERNAYCRLDARGDIVDVIKVLQLNKDSDWDSIDVVTINRRELDKFMALSKTCLVLRFDFTRVRWGSFAGWGEIDRYTKEEADLYYHGGVDGQGSYCNGLMIVRPRVTVADLVRHWKAEENQAKRKYARFKIFDRKNDVNVETSCAPAYLSNYFQKSNLPWEISPAFFRPEVLHRFKADPEKYTLDDRSITCRNAWHLKTYDINEAGQVHTYIGYLADLPYEEQLYWQSFNEWPKGSISKRAFQTDIVGDWHLEHEPLGALKHAISLLDASPPAWWKKRGTEIADAVRYPATDSIKEWADEILAFDQFLVEGFLPKPLRRLAADGGSATDPTWGALRLLQEVLVSQGQTEAAAKSLVLPMQKLHALRTEVRGHAAVEKKRAAESDARRQCGTLRAHFQSVVADCEKSFTAILGSLGVELKQ